MQLKKILKKIASFSPIPLTSNEYNDRLTERVIKKVCKADSVCIDIGANEGKILKMFIQNCPAVLHYAFEPIPVLYHHLKRRYGSASNIYKLAISDKKGTSNFNYVITDPAYSGLIKRPYNKPQKDETIQVATDTLDNILPLNLPVQLIKLDIEGGEYNALLGAANVINRHHPYLLFEFGKGGSEAYGITPAKMFDLLVLYGYKVNTLKRFLQSKPSLTLSQFEHYFNTGSVYFFIAFKPQ